MTRCAITPYEGSKPYIFVSYAHKDSQLVFPVMEELDRRGYRVWYDDGIAPGSEWPENIAQHLSDCSLFLSFVSPNSMESDNCRREVTFALSKRKPFLGVMLQPTQMSPGMEMQMSAQQCVLKYTYKSDEAFYRKLVSCPDLEPCLDRPQPVSPPQPEPVRPQQPAPAQPTAPTPKPAEKKKPSPRASTGGATPKVRLVLGVAAGLLAALLLWPFHGPQFTQIQITQDKTVSVAETYLHLNDETITKEVVTQINKLGQLRSLIFQNCTFESGALGTLNCAASLSGLTIWDCAGVDDLSCLTPMTELYSLELVNIGLTDELLPKLEHPYLETVNFSDNPDFTDLSRVRDCVSLSRLHVDGTGVTDLSQLPDDGLTAISFSNTQVADVTPLADHTTLTEIFGANTGVTDIDPLADLAKLTRLDFNNCGVAQPTRTFACLRLEGLYLGDSQVSDLTPFGNCTVLEEVDLYGTRITDLSVLEKSAATITLVNLCNLGLDSSQLQFLTQFSALRCVVLDDNPLGNLSMLRNASGLTMLSAVHCELTDISALYVCKDLNDLNLSRNQITDISPLANMNTKDSVFMDLSGNPISDFSPLPALQYDVLALLCSGADLSTLPSGLSGRSILVPYKEELLTSVLTEDPFLDLYVYNCPADKQVAVEDEFRYYLTLVFGQEDLVELAEGLGIYGYEDLADHLNRTKQKAL